MTIQIFIETTLQIQCSKWTIIFFTCNFLFSGRWKKNKPPASHDTSNYCWINCSPCYVAVWYQFSLNCCNCTFCEMQQTSNIYFNVFWNDWEGRPSVWYISFHHVSALICFLHMLLHIQQHRLSRLPYPWCQKNQLALFWSQFWWTSYTNCSCCTFKIKDEQQHYK